MSIKRIIISALVLLLSVSVAGASAVRREGMKLDGMWKFTLLKDSLLLDNFYKEDFSDKAWDEIPVPGCLDALGYIEPKYVNPENVEALYRTTFDIPGNWLKKEKHIFLRFDGVLKGYEIWVNGNYAGKWESAFNSCQFDITPYIRRGNNLIAVRNYMRYKGSDFDSNDDWGQAGINRSVSVFPVDDFHVSDMAVVTDGVSGESAMVKFKLKLESFSGNAVTKKLTVRLKSPDGKKIATEKLPVSSFPFEVSDSILVSRPRLWTAETPELYTLEYSLGRRGKQRTNVGIRDVKVDGKLFTVNGKAIKLRGVCYHDTDPFTGKVISRERLLQDLTMMKQANVNFIRCSHYPKDPSFYDLCDSLGFYVMDEVPFGFGDKDLYDESFQDVLMIRAEATVTRDKNHPCIIVWSVGNENPLTTIAAETGKYVKELDPSRPICYPMMHDYFISLDFDIPDFVDIFAPHYPTVNTLNYFADNSDRPVICTEYCHSLGQSLEQHDELWEIMQSRDILAGGAVWEWVDQGMVKRNSAFPGRFAAAEDLWLADSTCVTMHGNEGTDGILYADRTPLSNYYEVRHNYAQARVLTDTLVCAKGSNSISLAFDNRFDFTDLADNVEFLWTLKNGNATIGSGKFVVDCKPGETESHMLDLELPEDPEKCFYTLEIIPCSKQWGELGKYSIPVVGEDGCYGSDLYACDSDSADILLPETYLRIGRKKGLAEMIRAKNAPVHYLIKAGDIQTDAINEITFSNDEFKASGTVSVKKDRGHLDIDAEIVPSVDGLPLLEAGLAFRFDDSIQYVQWLGNGPYATYPGKNKSGFYGLHSLRAGDLYFEGNRIGVDVAVLTDSEGKGYLLISKGSNMNFENTDKGLIVTVNDKVAGVCGKLRRTSFPVFSSKESPIKVSLKLYPFDIKESPASIRSLFVDPSDIGLFNPFIARYDDFELPLDDIL